MPLQGQVRAAFDGMSYCSFMVACNHADAIAIPANDRRFTVLLNGREMTPEEAKAFAAWMEVPGNIAALSRFLAERDLSNFNMFQPLDTAAKQDMAELALTQVEGILRDLMEDDKQELVFTRYQMEREVETDPERRRTATELSGGHWRGEFEGAWKPYCVLLKTKDGSPSRVRVAGQANEAVLLPDQEEADREIAGGRAASERAQARRDRPGERRDACRKRPGRGVRRDEKNPTTPVQPRQPKHDEFWPVGVRAGGGGHAEGPFCVGGKAVCTVKCTADGGEYTERNIGGIGG